MSDTTAEGYKDLAPSKQTEHGWGNRAEADAIVAAARERPGADQDEQRRCAA